jgi:hypothetical protein
MYGYAVSFILIFLTHPGVAYNFFSPGIWGGLFQAVFVLAMHGPSNGSPAFATTMAILYWFLLFLWAFVKVQLAKLSILKGF